MKNNKKHLNNHSKNH